MSNDRCNKSIHCTVEQCANHCPTASYCALGSITVGTHEANPTMDQCTDCKSLPAKVLLISPRQCRKRSRICPDFLFSSVLI